MRSGRGCSRGREAGATHHGVVERVLLPARISTMLNDPEGIGTHKILS